MKHTRLIVVGGFLGAGKTTCIIGLAKKLLSNGKKVGIVTNDQGSSLVDTKYMQNQGLPVLEVTGGCFCCNFDEFTAILSRMTAEQYPDYILAEPVGSCTDLVATIMKPMKKAHSSQFALSPLTIVVDPKRLRRVIQETGSPFPNEINYLFKKQIEEADIIALNKIDTLKGAEIKDMAAYLGSEFPQSEVVMISAKDEKGLDGLLSHITEYNCDFVKPSLEIEYPTYARAEAGLGWLNLTAAISSGNSFDANIFVKQLAEEIKHQLSTGMNEIAHLKIYVVSSNDFAKLSCVSIHDAIEFDRKMSLDTKEASLIINIRAAAEPALIKQIAEDSIRNEADRQGCSILNMQTEAFKPGYPNPVHRL